MIKLDELTKKQFIRDYSLPIQITKDDFFQYYLELYQDDYKSLDKYNLLLKTINDVGGIEKFNQTSKELKHNAIDFVLENPEYKIFEKDPLNEFNSKFDSISSLYKQPNVGKTFVSIDLVKANVQAFNFYNKALLGNSKDYDEFISKFTEHKYLKESKQIRQVIFGNLSPKKQQKIQKFIMSMVRNELINLGLAEKEIKSASPDELVFEYNKDCYNQLMDFSKSEKLKNISFHIDVFELNNIREDISIFIKNFKNKDGFSIKQCNSKLMPEVIKHIKGIPLIDKDLAFFDEGRIAYYKEPFI